MTSEPAADSGSLRITQKDVYSEVVGTRADVARIEGAMNVIIERHSHTVNVVDDHETRLRDLERWRYAIPAGLITAVLAAIAAFIR